MVLYRLPVCGEANRVRRRRAPVAAAVLAVAGGSFALTSGSSDADADSQTTARQAFQRYTGSFAADGEFAAPDRCR